MKFKPSTNKIVIVDASKISEDIMKDAIVVEVGKQPSTVTLNISEESVNIAEAAVNLSHDNSIDRKMRKTRKQMHHQRGDNKVHMPTPDNRIHPKRKGLNNLPEDVSDHVRFCITMYGKPVSVEDVDKVQDKNKLHGLLSKLTKMAMYGWQKADGNMVEYYDKSVRLNADRYDVNIMNKGLLLKETSQPVPLDFDWLYNTNKIVEEIIAGPPTDVHFEYVADFISKNKP